MCDRAVVPSLEDTCVRWIAKNLTLVTSRQSCGTDSKCFWLFPHSSYRISARPAQKILQKLCKYGIIKDEYMTLFSSRYVDLISPVLKEAPVTPAALRILREFELYNLTATNLKEMNLNSLIGCLGEDTAENLVSLNVSGLSIMENKIPVVVSLGRLRKLQMLNVSKTKFTNECLQTAVKCLPHLRFLNISRTNIDCINALLPLQKSLTGLIMHRLHLKTTKGMFESILNVILQLRELRVLDVSSESQRIEVHVSGVEILCSGQALPHLTHIDLCGNPFGLTLSDVANLIQNHPHLEFAGLAAWPQRHRHELEGIYQLTLKYPHITMLADRGQKPLLAILLRNKDRRQYLQTAFHNIFEETSSREWLDPELLAAVLRVMRLHMNHSDMILAGTAVVYNLTRGEQSAQLPLDLLNRAVNITLTAIEQHQKLLQLLKNCFLTLCSDTVLHRAQFSCKRCCELVFQSLIKYDDVHMKRMGVAIISILAAEVPTSDLRDLSSDRRRLERLLIYVVEKCLLASDVQELLALPLGQTLQYLQMTRCQTEGPPVYDTTLRFTLSALWNLTDECPDACQGFVEVGGLYVYAKVLKKMTDQEEDFKNHVYTKCLGLLNNVAEVASTKTSLLMEPLMDFFLKMLSHPSIQISYFAAGIVSHLACLTDKEWLAANQYHKSGFIKVLGTAVRNWSPPQTEMVAYRSFQPFQSLILHEESRLEIHLWAVWAIHHILTKKDSRYVPVLRECPDLQLFLVYVVSMDPAALCSTDYRFSEFLRALSLYHKAVDPSSTSATPSPHLLPPFDLDILELGASLPTSWRCISNALVQYLDTVGPFPHRAGQGSENRACARLFYSCPLGGDSAMTPPTYDGAGTNLPALQTPADSVARLPNTFDPVGMSDVNDLLTAGGAGAATCSTSSALGTGKYAVSVASPLPSSSSVAAPFVGPEENQMACARLLQKLAREILQAAENFENQSAMAAATAGAGGVHQSSSPSYQTVP